MSLAAALEYARLGLRVFPCKASGAAAKAPHTVNGWKDASKDPEQIEAWWRQWPEAMVGAPIPPGFVVLDLDAAQHGGLESDLPELVPTRTACSRGRAGANRHFWFRVDPADPEPSDRDFKARLVARHGRSEAGWDLRLAGKHYVVMPGSVRAGEAPYEWLHEGPADAVAVAALPPGLAVLIRPEPRAVAVRQPAGRPAVSPIATWEATVRWADLLPGWDVTRGDGESPGSFWRHPSATAGHSASISQDPSGVRMYCYSPNAGLSTDTGLSKFDVLTESQFGGDRQAALTFIGVAPRQQAQAAQQRPAPARGEPRMLDETWDCRAASTNPQRPVESWLESTGHQILHWRQGFYRWARGEWRPLADDTLRSWLAHDFAHAEHPVMNGAMMTWSAFKPTDKKLTELMKTLAAVRHRPSDLPADSVLSFANGLLDLETGRLSAHTPAVFNLHRIEQPYVADAVCRSWDAFLAEALPEPDQRLRLQEVMGYLISGRSDLHKVVGIWGPPRAGKGTTVRVLEAILGRDAFTSPTLDALAGSFGLESCLNASVIVVNEARFGREHRPAVGLILAVSGGDSVSVNLKGKPAVQAVLPGRFLLVSNELPNVRESSGAFASRYVHVGFNVSALGREDTGLGARLEAELPGIVVWALDGLKRLNAQGGRFTETAEGTRLDRRLSVVANDALAWVQERCEPAGFNDRMLFADLRSDYLEWAEAHDLPLPETDKDRSALNTRLGRQLTEAGFPTAQVKVHGEKAIYRLGVRLRDAPGHGPAAHLVAGTATVVPLPAPGPVVAPGPVQPSERPVPCATSGCTGTLPRVAAAIFRHCQTCRDEGRHQ